jgi:hypothetical protein
VPAGVLGRHAFCCANKEMLMGCFCHKSLLALPLPSLNISASLALPGMNVPLGLSAYLNAAGLPTAPWMPEPGWLTLPLPQLKLSLQAVATISAMASLRAQVLAQFGIDLLIPGQAMAMARIVATLNARLSAMANINFNPLGWLQLAQLNAAIDQINLALSLGVLMPSASMMLSLTVPGGVPMPRWGSFLALLKALCPMIAATAQLNVSLSATAELAAALRIMARLSLPALIAPQLMASLTAALSAVVSLQASLGISPLTLGFPAIQLRVQARLAALLPALSAHFGINLAGVGLPNLLALLLSLLPKLPVVPSSFATSAVVQAAMQMQAMASLNWQVPALIPAVQIGLPVCALAAQLQAALAITAVLPSPCGSGCDAAKLASALAA